MSGVSTSGNRSVGRGWKAVAAWLKGGWRTPRASEKPSYPNLEQFFSGYFNQDWLCDASDWQGIVANYLQDAPPEMRGATVAGLEQLMEEGLTEEQLAKRLLYEFHCCYNPRPDLGGPTFAEWLGQVRDALCVE